MKKYKKDIALIAGSFMITGFHATQADEGFQKMLETFSPLGIILFYRNIQTPSQVKKLCGEAQKISFGTSGQPLITCLDQEGGYVGRFRDRAILYPSPMALTAAGSKDFLFSAGYYSSLLLRSRGLNMNLAPVLDICTNPFNPSLGPRSFSSRPGQVVRSAKEWIRGAQKAGLLLSVKHFPGKGRAQRDSHLELPEVKARKKDFFETDLVPFKKILTEKFDAVMTSHAWYSCLEKHRKPGTFSQAINSDLLRNTIGHRGLLITDDLEMGAIKKNYDLGSAAVMAVKSGVDAVLVCKSPLQIKKVFKALYQAVENGDIGEGLIKESLLRKALVRKKILKLSSEKKQISPDKIKEASLRVLTKNCSRSLTVLKGRRFLPVNRDRELTIVFSGVYPRILVEDRMNEWKDFRILLKKKCSGVQTKLIVYKSYQDFLRKISQSLIHIINWNFSLLFLPTFFIQFI